MKTTPIRSIQGVEDRTFGFHALLLDEAGLAKCFIGEDSDSPVPEVQIAIVWRLTWDGFEFSQTIRDPAILEKAKENSIKPTVTWSFGLLLEILKYEAKKKLGFGIDGPP